MNDYLTGSNANLSTVLDTTLDRLKGATIEGNDLQLTLNARAQQRRAPGTRQPLRRGRRARARHRQGARDGLLPDLRPERRRGQLRPGHRHARRLQAPGRAPQPRHRRPLRAGLDLQGRDRLGRDRLRPLQADLELRRPRLLRGLRQAGQQLRHVVALRPARPAHGAEVLGQLGLLQHRQGARSEEAGRVREALRLLLDAAPRDARRTSGRRAASTRAPSSSTRRRTPTSTRAGSRSARSACS